MPGSFYDSNVLLYTASCDSKKATRADALVANGGFISVQVLNEMANVARRKMRLSWDETRAFIDPFTQLLIVCNLDIEMHRRGILLAEKYKLSVFDSFIVAAALECHCEVLWSEDMQNGVVIEGQLTVHNPFLD